MGYLTYNSIPMQVESFQRFDQRSVYSDDGADYLYTEFTIVVRAFFDPTTATGFSVDLGTSNAATIVNVLRSVLLAPRKILLVAAPSGGNSSSIPFLRSPLLRPSPPFAANTSYAVDAKNGPQPLFCNIQQIIGERSMIVDFGIVTWINECPGTSSSPISPVLSHRWSMSHLVDEMQHTKRIIAGQAIFRTDLLYDSLGNIIIRADDFRDFLFHNIPPNYRRIGVHVEASTDGTQLKYVVEDQEVDGVVDPTINLQAEVAHIEGTYSEINDAAPGISISDLPQSAQPGAIVPIDNDSNGRPVSRVVGGRAGTAFATTLALAKGIFPARSFEVNVRVQGTRRATRAGLVRVAIRAAMGFRVGSIQVDANGNVTNFYNDLVRNLSELFLVSNSLQIGLVDKWVQLRVTYRATGLTSTIHQLMGLLKKVELTPRSILIPGIDALIRLFNFFTGNNEITNPDPPLSAYSPDFPDFLPGVTKSFGLDTDSYGPRGGSLQFGFEKASRGSTIAHLVTQAFGTPCSEPAAPQRATGLWNAPSNSVNQARQ